MRWEWLNANAHFDGLANPITLSADHKSVQLDNELRPAGVQGGPMPGPEHVKGTITCP